MLELRQISKSYPGVQALSAVDLSVAAGEIHALVGENGAGKSTLTRIVSGADPPDSGQMTYDGAPARWSSPAEARRRGVHVIHQELVLFPNLSVAENVYLGNERRGTLGAVDHRRATAEAGTILGKLGAHIDPRALVGELSVADRQMVEIARALVNRLKLLILDEPTAVIAGREVELLFERLRGLRSSGVAIVYISHRLDEVFELSDRVTVLKDGKWVATRPTQEITRDRLVSLMVGRDLAHLFPPRRPRKAERPVVLRTERLSVAGRVTEATLELRAGEITALAGMIGSGRSELAFGIFGALPITSGSVIIGGTAHSSMTPARAIALGIGLATEDRKEQGLATLMSVAANLTAPALLEFTRHGRLDRRAERTAAEESIRTFAIACRGPDTRVETMSGGNQQKLVVARWARTRRKVLILDEPTRGIDVGAKLEIYRMIQELADAGLAILLISSELPEVVGLADRVLVMREGRFTGELVDDQISEEAIMALATRSTGAAA